MGVWIALWLLVVGAVGTFAAVNWHVLAAQTTISLVVTRVTAPIGLVMLGGIAGAALLFLIFLVWLETRTLVHMGRQGVGSSDNVIRSQIAELRSELERHVDGLNREHSQSMLGVVARLERLERAVTDAVKELASVGATH